MPVQYTNPVESFGNENYTVALYYFEWCIMNLAVFVYRSVCAVVLIQLECRDRILNPQFTCVIESRIAPLYCFTKHNFTPLS